MLFRNVNDPIVDAGVCAIQGYLGAVICNVIRKEACFSPGVWAMACAIFVLTERIFNRVNRANLGGSDAMYGPVPDSFSRIVSFSTAAYATAHIMRIVEIISTIPQPVSLFGKIGGAITLGAFIITKVQQESWRAEPPLYT